MLYDIAGSTLGLPLVASNLWAMPQDWEPADWGEEQAQRVAAEVRRLRGKRSTQWLSDRTAEVGHRINRGTLADLENGRRRYVTITELIVLAAALSTAPLALLYPGPDYRDEIQVVPFGPPGTEMFAVNWFSGLVAGRPAQLWAGLGVSDDDDHDDDRGDDLELVSAGYHRNLAHLARAYVYDDLQRRLITSIAVAEDLRAELEAGTAMPGDQQRFDSLRETIVAMNLQLREMTATMDAAIEEAYGAG